MGINQTLIVRGCLVRMQFILSFLFYHSLLFYKKSLSLFILLWPVSKCCRTKNQVVHRAGGRSWETIVLSRERTELSKTIQLYRKKNEHIDRVLKLSESTWNVKITESILNQVKIVGAPLLLGNIVPPLKKTFRSYTHFYITSVKKLFM